MDYWFMTSLEITLTWKNANIHGSSDELEYPDVCICGNVKDPVKGSRLRYHCPNCHGMLGQTIPLLHCEYWILELALATAIAKLSKAKSTS